MLLIVLGSLGLLQAPTDQRPRRFTSTSATMRITVTRPIGSQTTSSTPLPEVTNRATTTTANHAKPHGRFLSIRGLWHELSACPDRLGKQTGQTQPRE